MHRLVTFRAVGLGLLLSACAQNQAAESPGRAPSAGSASAEATPGVVAGVYDLELSAQCDSAAHSVTGTLKLTPIAAAEATARSVDPRLSASLDRPLLWGQTDAPMESFATCLGSSASPRDPISEKVLVDVLEWEGTPERQVLLVSTGGASSASANASNAGGIALWVERVEPRRVSGAWSHWQLADQPRGRWVAELR